jgi:hypothetical protein
MEENKPNSGNRGNNANNTVLLEAEMVRPKSTTVVQNPETKPVAEGNMSMFWRVFGGTILSIVALVVITVYNNISSSLGDLRRDLNSQIETKSEFVKKGDLERSTTSLWTAVKEVRTSANAVDTLNEKSKVIESQIDRNAKSASDERKELQGRIEENRKSAQEEARELVKKLEELRKNLDDERKEFLRKLDEQRKVIEDERKELGRKLEEKEKLFADQHKELNQKLQVMAERLAAVESRLNVKTIKAAEPLTEPAAKKKKVDSGN